MTQPTDPAQFDREAIINTIPHKPPFLFVDSIVIDKEKATGTYTLDGSCDFFSGHFPGDPIFPASLMMESLGQVAVFWLLQSSHSINYFKKDIKKGYFISVENIRCSHFCRPGQMLHLTVTFQKGHFPLAIFDGNIECEGNTVAKIKGLKLACSE